MSSYTERFSEVHELLADIHPASYSAVQDTGYVSLANYQRAVIICTAGVLGQAVDFDIEEGTSTAGAGAQTHDAGSKDFTWAATTDNNVVSIIEIRPEELDIADRYHCINVEATPAGQSAIFGVQIWGIVPRFAPVSVAGLERVED